MAGLPFKRRLRTPTILQMEAVECGAASLAILLAHYGRHVSLEELRAACGVSRDGSKASNVVKAARAYGLTAGGKRYDIGQLRQAPMPAIVFWNFNHFLVVEGFGKGVVHINDPATGPRKVTDAEFSDGYTGVTLAMAPGPDFQKGGNEPSLARALASRLRGVRAAFAFVVIATLALVLPGLALPVFTQVFIDEILIKRLDGWLQPLLLGMLVTALLRMGLTALQQSQLLRLEMRLSLQSSASFFWHVLRLPIEFFNQRYVGDISVRVTANDRVAHLLAGDLATNAVNVLSVLFYAAIMATYDVGLTLAGIAITALNLLVLRAIARKRRDDNLRLLQDRGKLMAVTMGGVETIETLKATGGEGDFFARWSGHLAKVINGEQRLELNTRLLAVLPNLLNALVSVAILGLGGLRVIDGRMSIGMLVAFQGLMASFTQPVTNLMGLAGKLQEAQGDMARLDDVLNFPAAVGGSVGGAPEGGALVGRLELRNLRFGYSRLEAPLIEDFSLTLEPGRRIALVGGSGSGKSTVARLVTGVLKPWEGQVLLDGIPRDQIARDRLHATLGSVDQDVYLFAGTIRDNLSLWDGTLPPEEMVSAARDAAIHDVIAARTGGYDAPVEEAGANFSGGERQRLEIARALAGRPRVLVLDEATSALDPVTEKAIDGNLRRRGCACLIVAHRLSTIRDCDEIIVMDRGRIAERGSHDTLMALGGRYSTLIATDQ
ncbi:NHLP family bacteriocin export ABC transporter peptidase/permease/ATPase subunit [Nitrospirillum viridazoti]|uniref:NHLP family bacteriocin export ABC transporter peptidase/permease/ATPase subunit n=1 Tax=Nitrospirillum viridazoti CBAmc TaxID=1441467 RepID=A0A248JZE4_9PROT|nr:NHLP family bacteriocin export ABC transporter peptidase/permease/ATPase subunit [Nitrospirillum amazonense]ASG24085.1 NHLP family bacteriocin export ABC transporter peptidase/permease/ATPase subunit [Nitrospirillum amazonense CBAmc]TWB40932.1 NHLM bacteriocin system ABC transporter peptidase/ATP-binding protein [Nitrospirillum amazonense]